MALASSQPSPDPAAEVPLAGGNVSAGVVRVGDTVRRPAGPWTPAVHELLRYLRSAGFDAAPEPLGLDERGREVLRYVPGVVPSGAARGPDSELLASAAAVRRAGRLVREFHDIVAGFVPPAGAAWQVLVPPDRQEIIAHHDLAPWNLVIGKRWVFIDWDLAAPGSRLWDLAWTALGFVPVTADPLDRRPDEGARLRALADGYGLAEHGRRDLAALLSPRAEAMHLFLADRAARREEPWLSLWRQGHGAAWRGSARYAAAHEAAYAAALLA